MERRGGTGEEEALCRSLRAGTEQLLTGAALAYATEHEWRDRLRAVAYALLHFLQEDRVRARQMTVDVLSAGEHAQLIRDQGMEVLIELIDQGRWERPDPESVDRVIAEGIGGAIYHRIHLAVAAEEWGALESMVPELMYNAVLPYLGSEAAREELTMPPPDNPVSRGVGRVPSG